MIIAEIGQNHLGDYELAKKYVRNLCSIEGLDGLTFQIREEDHRQRKSHLYFDWSHYDDLYGMTKSEGKLFGVAITDEELIDFFEKLQVDFYKVIRDGVFNKNLITTLAKTKKPILVSVGLCSEKDILELSELLSDIEGDIRLIYTNRDSVELEEANLSIIKTLRNYWDHVGYGSHCDNPINLLLASCYDPTDMLFYVKDDNSDIEFPDNIWAVGIDTVEELIENINICKSACGNGVLK